MNSESADGNVFKTDGPTLILLPGTFEYNDFFRVKVVA